MNIRDPKVENKYNLCMADVKRMRIVDRNKICEPIFWRNNVINAWCICRDIGSDADIKFGSENSVWIGIYDKPYYGKYVHVKVSCWGGMGKYLFKKFYDYKDIENERDLETQEATLELLNMLIDNGIVEVKDQ